MRVMAMKPHPKAVGSKRHLEEASIRIPRGGKIHVGTQKVPSPLPSKQLPSSSQGIFTEGPTFYNVALLCTRLKAHVNSALNNAIIELNNNQQPKERGIRGKRRGSGSAFADEAGGESLGSRGQELQRGRIFPQQPWGCRRWGRGRSNGRKGKRERDHAWKPLNNRERVHSTCRMAKE